MIGSLWLQLNSDEHLYGVRPPALLRRNQCLIGEEGRPQRDAVQVFIKIIATEYRMRYYSISELATGNRSTAMSTEAITIKVDSEAASAFNNAPAEEQRKMEALVSLWLKEIAAADARPLREVMDEIGREAQRKGITAEILDSLLKDE